VFDAELLKPIIAELGAQLQPLKHDPRNKRLDDLPGKLIAVDGTELSAPPEAAKLADRMIQGRDIKLHTHFEVLTGVPVDIDLTAAKDSEIENLMGRLASDRVYVKDRGYACFKLLQAICDIRSHFVCRVRDNSVYELIEDRPLSPQAKAIPGAGRTQLPGADAAYRGDDPLPLHRLGGSGRTGGTHRQVEKDGCVTRRLFIPPRRECRCCAEVPGLRPINTRPALDDGPVASSIRH